MENQIEQTGLKKEDAVDRASAVILFNNLREAYQAISVNGDETKIEKSHPLSVESILQSCKIDVVH